jgi:hypothetical protein
MRYTGLGWKTSDAATDASPPPAKLDDLFGAKPTPTRTPRPSTPTAAPPPRAAPAVEPPPLVIVDSNESIAPPLSAEEQAALAAAAAAAAAAAEFARGKELVRQFVSARCDVKPFSTSFINAEPLSAEPKSFGSELRAWAAAKGVREPSLFETQHALSELGVLLVETRYREVHGVELQMHATPVCTWGRLWVEGLTVLVHFWLLVAPGLVLLTTSMYAQDVFAMTTATKQPLLWQQAFSRAEGDQSHHWLRSLYTDSSQILTTVRLAVIECVAFTAATAIHMCLHYADVCQPALVRAKKVFDRLYSLLLLLHVLLLLLHVFVNLTWCVLAAILDPVNFLPAGTAIVVAIFVIVSTKRELSAAASKLRALLSAAFETRLQATLTRAKAAIDSDRREAQMRELGLSRGLFAGTSVIVDDEVTTAVPPAAGAGTPAPPQPPAPAAPPVALAELAPPAPTVTSAADAKLLPSDVFALLTDGNSTSLTVDAFTKLFERLDLQLSDARKEQLFAYMDTSGARRARAGGRRASTGGARRALDHARERPPTAPRAALPLSRRRRRDRPKGV